MTTRVDELLEDGWVPSPREVAAMVRQVGTALARLHAGGAVHGGVGAACVERTEEGAFVLRTADAAGRDPSVRRAPEVLDGDAPSPASDAYELAALVCSVQEAGGWAAPETFGVAVQRALREDPAGRPSVTAFVVCATEELPTGRVDATGVDTQEAAGAEETAGSEEDRVEEVPDVQEETVVEEPPRDDLARLRESLRAAAHEPPRTGLGRGGLRPGVLRRALLTVAVGVALLAGAGWWLGGGGGAEGTVAPVPAASPSVPPSAPPASHVETSPAESTAPSREASHRGESGQEESTEEHAGRDPRATRSGGSAGRQVTLPDADALEELLEGRAAAWAQDDPRALARYVLRGSPAWHRDRRGEPTAEDAVPDYRVNGVEPAPVEDSGEEGLVAVTAMVAAGEQPARAVRLELASGTGRWRLADWEVVR